MDSEWKGWPLPEGSGGFETEAWTDGEFEVRWFWTDATTGDEELVGGSETIHVARVSGEQVFVVRAPSLP